MRLGLGRRRPRGTAGYPTSSNRASSMHLVWVLDPDAAPVEAASVTLTVVDPPVTGDLVFWALQASFAGGGAHLGLQWFPIHPGGTAANFGGYAHRGGELEGSRSAFPSAPGNANTRDFPWVPGRPYRLRIAPAAGAPGWWAGSIDGVELRRLHGGGATLEGLMVWTECFARCDAPASAVRWSDPSLEHPGGAVSRPRAYRVNYQSVADGGCAGGTAAVDPATGAVEQRTSVERLVPAGALLPVV